MLRAIKYTVGSNAYGYVGFGDLFVFLFFGLLSVCGSYFLYTKSLPLAVFLPAFSIGFLSAGVLNLNNMRDVVSDYQNQ
ncbi:MAG: UbiA family prenyltransferase [Flavobacteriaceae bacterium]|nr:UbiA family prenyltransferase [Flavobacteriaceae bacterium]